VGIATPRALIYKVLFLSISTFETPPFFIYRQFAGKVQRDEEGQY
jgi:hypothetical protein